MDTPTNPPVMNEKRAALLKLSQEINARIGIVPDPTWKFEDLRALQEADMKANGWTAEDNIGSRELMRMRYGDNWEAELAEEEARWAREDAAQEALQAATESEK